VQQSLLRRAARPKMNGKARASSDPGAATSPTCQVIQARHIFRALDCC
jgi:hypothetical protein